METNMAMKKAPHGFKPIGNKLAGKPQPLQGNKSKGARAATSK